MIGGSWRNELFDERGPHKRDLDRIESSRPVILYDYWGHSVWANSRALEMAGVDRDTPDVIPGLAYYQRDDDGEPTGWITESAASVFVKHFQAVTSETEQSLLRFLQYLRELGVTALWDAGNFGWDNEVSALVSRWDREGVLPLRYHGSYTLFLPDDLPNAVAELKRMRSSQPMRCELLSQRQLDDRLLVPASEEGKTVAKKCRGELEQGLPGKHDRARCLGAARV